MEKRTLCCLSKFLFLFLIKSLKLLGADRDIFLLNITAMSFDSDSRKQEGGKERMIEKERMKLRGGMEVIYILFVVKGDRQISLAFFL